MGFSNYKKIIFHCGIHKTGSSYLQSVLRKNADKLASRSIHYPGFLGPHMDDIHGGNHSLLAMNYKGKEDLDRYFSSIVRLSSDSDTLLISGEEFSREIYIERLLPNLMRAKGNAQLVFVIYLRRFDHLLESVYAESVKRALFGDVKDASYQLNFTAFLRPMVEAVGAENVIIRPYNKAHWPNGSLGDDFSAAIGHPGLWQTLGSDPNERLNISLSRSHTFLLSRLRNRAAKQNLLEYFHANSLELPPDESKFFMPPERRRILNSNHYIVNQPFFDEHGFGDLKEMLDLESFPDVDDWTEFQPNWKQLHLYLSAFIDSQYSE